MRTTRYLVPVAAVMMLAASTAFAEAQDPSPVLVSTEWLAGRLADEKLVVLHVGNEMSFSRGHIAGARAISSATFAPQRNGLSTEMPDSAAFRAALEAVGISNDSRIVIYSPTNPPTLAARLYVTLEHFGLGGQISLLDGGLPAWRAENRVVETEVSTPLAQPGRLTLSSMNSRVATHDAVGTRFMLANAAIVDARDTRFYTGEALNAQLAARAGRVPNAVNIVYSSLVSSSGLLLPRDSLQKIFTAAGVTPGKSVVTYCHVGQQASLAYLAAKLLGYDVMIYDGSYEDWSKRTELKVDSGPPRGG